VKHKKVIDVFINGVNNYFEQVDHKPSELRVGAPYLVKANETLGSDFTAMISVNGTSEGFVFFSAPRVMLKYLLLSYGEAELTEALLSDLAGEVANTIAGNARRDMGDGFLISPPTVTREKIKREFLGFSSRSFVMPLRWKNATAHLIVCLNSEAAQ